MNHLELFHYALAVLRFVRARAPGKAATLATLRALAGMAVLMLVACTPPGGSLGDGDAETARYAVTGFAFDPRDTSSSSATDLDGQGPHYDNRAGVTLQFLAQIVLRGGTTLASREDLELVIDREGPGTTLAGVRFPTHQTAPVNAPIPLPLFAATATRVVNARTIDAYDLQLELAPHRDHGSLRGAIALDDFIAALVDAVAERLAAMPARDDAPLPFVDEDRDGALGVREITQLLGGGDLSLESDGAIAAAGQRGSNTRPAVSFAIHFALGARDAPPSEQPVTVR